MTIDNAWRHCGACKKPILINSKYYQCGVSTCKKTAYCSMPCFDDHVPIFRHKDAWAEEKLAPKTADEVDKISSARLVSRSTSEELPKDILIVASKLKDYIRIKAGMNTSANVMDRLSDMVRLLSDKAIDRAQREQRKTLMDRDFYL